MELQVSLTERRMENDENDEQQKHLVFDFDGTITTKDTISHLAGASIVAQKVSRGQDLRPAWDALVEAYLADYAAYKSMSPKESERTLLTEEKRFLAGLKDVEEASLRRVGNAHIFMGLDAAAMRKMGADAVANGDVQLRPGFARIVGLARKRGWPVSVVSVNWSTDFIRGALEGILREEDAVMANSTREEDGSIAGPPVDEACGPLLVCASDKARAMLHLAQCAGPSRVAYFGDSTTDLECLVGADRGVAMAENERQSSLLQTLERLGFEVPRVQSMRTSRVVWARTFDEVLESGML